MVAKVVVEPMTEEFIVWRCLHGGPLSRGTIDRGQGFGSTLPELTEGELTLNKFEATNGADIKGTFVGLVVANVPAFEAATRCSPIDGMNLARTFPGDANGSVRCVVVA